MESNALNKSTNDRNKIAVRALRLGLRVTEAISLDLAATWAKRLFTTPRRFARPEREAEILAVARRFEVYAAGQKLAAWEWGAGPAVLLVHGWEGRGAQLGAFVDPLVEAGYRVLTFDAPAHGDSTGRAALLVDFADAVVALDQLVEGFHAIIAHSFGAAATTLALKRGARAARVLYVSPAAELSSTIARFVQFVGLSAVVSMAVEHRLERQTGIRINELEGASLSKRMRVPLLIMHDRLDREVPWTEGRTIAEAWPHAKLELTEELGHRKILRDEGVIARALEFVGIRHVAPMPQRSFAALHLS